MGFFSRSNGSTTAVDNGLKPTKSKWYSSKPKSIHSNQSTPTLANLPPPPLPAKQQLQQQQQLPVLNLTRSPAEPPLLSSSIISGASGNGEFGVNGYGSSNMEKRPSTIGLGVNKRASKANFTEDEVTVTLASRLNELSVAHADGLLGDEEYRVLRQGVFERFASGNSVPVEEQVGRVPRPGMSPREELQNLRENQRTPTPRASVSNASFRYSIHPAHSVRSTTSSNAASAVGSFFSKIGAGSTSSPPRKDSKLNGHGHHHKETSDASSMYSSTSTSYRSHHGASEGIASASNLSTYLASHSAYGSTSRLPRQPSIISSRSILTSHTHLSTAPDNRSLRTSSIYSSAPSSYHVRNLSSSHSTRHGSETALPGSDMTIEQMRVEIEEVEAEGRRLVDSFNALELAALKNGGKSNGKSSAAGVVDLDSSWAIVSPPSPLPAPLSGVPALKPAIRLSRPASSQPLSSLPVTLSRSGSSSTRSSPRESAWNYLPTSSMANNSHSRPPTTSPRKQRTLSRQFELPEGDTEDENILSLQKELDDIRRKRKDVTERYEKRLEFLMAKLKGAEIKQRSLK